jgi:hypothetical protein
MKKTNKHLENIVKDIMIEYGPDGHTNGSEELAEFIRDIAIKFLQYYYDGASNDDKLLKEAFNLFIKELND